MVSFPTPAITSSHHSGCSLTSQHETSQANHHETYQELHCCQSTCHCQQRLDKSLTACRQHRCSRPQCCTLMAAHPSQCDSQPFLTAASGLVKQASRLVKHASRLVKHASGLVKHACCDLLRCPAGIGTEPTKGPPARGLKDHVHDMKAQHPAFGPDADDAAQDGEGSEEEAHAVTNMQS